MALIITERGDITELTVDAIVNPANSYALMGGGVAYTIKKKGGQKIEDEALLNTPISIGHAIATTAGALPCAFVIHAPTMNKPATKTTTENIKLATKAALECAWHHNFESIAFPGMGTGVGGVPKHDAVVTMVNTIQGFFTYHHDITLKKVILVGYSEDLYDEFQNTLKAQHLTEDKGAESKNEVKKASFFEGTQ